MIAAIIAAATFSFSATATGVEKGAPVEFYFAGQNSDRDYESMFLIEESIDSFCQRLEAAGIPRGKPVDTPNCRLWPTGCRITFDPPLEKFVSGKMPEGLPPGEAIYTGGTRLANGLCDAATNMPSALFSMYTLPQSPIVFNGIYDQGAVYGAFTAKEKLKKGDKYKFSISWDPTTLPRQLVLVAKANGAADLLKTIKTESEKGDLDVRVDFDPNLTVKEATAVANALATINSVKIKINGLGNIYYRSFTPLVKWLDRKERLVQPFELTLGNPDKLVFVEEDWKVEGTDPKLIPQVIQFPDVSKHPLTDTCFIFADGETKISRIMDSIGQFKTKQIRNWYVFQDNKQSLHNTP